MKKLAVFTLHILRQNKEKNKKLTRSTIKIVLNYFLQVYKLNVLWAILSLFSEIQLQFKRSNWTCPLD